MTPESTLLSRQYADLSRANGCSEHTIDNYLEPRHVDSERMLIRVERGKGQKDRQVLLSQALLLELRRCWKTYRPHRYLIEGKLPGQPIAATSIQRAFRAACQKAGIEKRVTPRSLRHAFAATAS